MIRKNIIKFGAPWCPACIQMDPILKDFCKENDIELESINADEGSPLIEQYKITSLPTTLVFREGTLLNKIIGFRNQRQLKKEIFGDD